jgi:hypothetical protein
MAQSNFICLAVSMNDFSMDSFWVDDPNNWFWMDDPIDFG